MQSEVNASVRGQTPLGEVDFQYGRAGYVEGCGGGFLYLAETPVLLASNPPTPEPPYLVVDVGDAVGEADVTVTIVGPDSQRVSTRGHMQVRVNHGTPSDDARSSASEDGLCGCDSDGPGGTECETDAPQLIEGRLVVEADGWSLRGDVRARLCHALHGECLAAEDE